MVESLEQFLTVKEALDWLGGRVNRQTLYGAKTVARQIRMEKNRPPNPSSVGGLSGSNDSAMKPSRNTIEEDECRRWLACYPEHRRDAFDVVLQAWEKRPTSRALTR
jgi:hypothetical protein